jgi:hypothetical protein
MRRAVTIVLILLGLAGVFIAARWLPETLFETDSETLSETIPAADLQSEPDPGVDPETRAAIETAVAEAVGRRIDTGLAFVVFDVQIDRLRVSPDGRWALLWLAGVDRETGEPAGIEPWIGIGVQEDGAWRVSLPGDADFGRLLDRVPEKIFPAEERLVLGDARGLNCDTSGIGPFTGYKLPWPAGQTLFLTQSIYHTLGWGFNPTFSMIHAFDFSTSPSSLFEVWAARPGTVRYFWDGQPNNDPTSPGNYIVLEDTGTSPKSYQLYLHLAQGSIPAALKTVGVPVQPGRFIGLADDTGASTGHHLHFQVHTEVNWWGCSVDVRFADVAINGGRPRLPIEAQTNPEYGAQGQSTYISGNTPPPPALSPLGGGVLTPVTGQTIAGPDLLLEGYAFDFIDGVRTAGFAYNTGQSWTPAGSPTNFPGTPGTVAFSASIDVCGLGIPDGPVTFGILAENDSGSVLQGGLAVPVILDADCDPPPPACSPAANQVAVFELENYGGSCLVFPVGEHVQSFAARSVRIGDNVSLTLYFSPLLRARSQSFFTDDPNLDDDRAALDLFASARVRLRTQSPGVPAPAWPASGQAMPLESSFSLVWHDGGGSREFQGRVNGPSGTLTSPWGSAQFWDPGPLPPGAYTWEVRARSEAGESAWSPSGSFTIAAANPIAATQVITAPVAEDFETPGTGWSGTGLWNRLQDGETAFNGLYAWWYGQPPGEFDGGDYRSGSPNAGSLTSPPIYIPGPGFYLRFYSRYQTENAGSHWDRRRVLVSAGEGPFLEARQLSDDLMHQWGRSVYLDLSAYSGQTIRIRFVFETMDAQFNDFQGWLLDAVTIDQNAPPACTAANEPDDTPAGATTLAFGVLVDGEICPVGDVDYYTFTGNTGDRIHLDVDAQSIGSQLDAYAFLLAGDGASVIAENDDEVPGVQIDPLLGYTLPASGPYYIKIRSYDHPGQGGNAFHYTLRLEADGTDPVIGALTASAPLDDIGSLPGTVTLTASASDGGSGLASVEFFYHSWDWGQDEWVSLGVDQNGTNGWSASWNTTVHAAQPGMALLAIATDAAGNTAAFGLWDLFPLPDALFLPITTR